MLVSEVISLAKTGELKQLRLAYVGDEDCDKFENEEVLLNYINLGLIELYKRFSLKKVTLELTPVIDGSSFLMADDYLYIYYVCGTDEYETTIPINNEFATMSVFENEPYTLTFVKDDELHSDIVGVNLTYIATPALLVDTAESVPLKYQFIDCLLQYMAFKGHSSLTASGDTDGNQYYQRFEASCRRLEKDGSMTPDNQSNYKLWMRGFV